MTVRDCKIEDNFCNGLLITDTPGTLPSLIKTGSLSLINNAIVSNKDTGIGIESGLRSTALIIQGNQIENNLVKDVSVSRKKTAIKVKVALSEDEADIYCD